MLVDGDGRVVDQGPGVETRRVDLIDEEEEAAEA